MGKPFAHELKEIENTINHVNALDITNLELLIRRNYSLPLYAVGSGGSFSACHFAELLHQEKGSFAKAMTPLDSRSALRTLGNCMMLFISAGGKNKDILFSFDEALKKEPKQIVSICTSKQTLLGTRAEQFSIASTFEFPLPTGKDGFLASNSLIAFFVLLVKIYGYKLKKNTLSQVGVRKDMASFLNRKDANTTTYKILYGNWSKPVAVDLESKLTEAALGNTLLADYRNFGHGRHHWIAKRPSNTSIIALTTKEDEALCLKTLAHIPKEVPILILKTNQNGPIGTIDLLIQSFYLVNEIGLKLKIDPGRPGVPLFGSKLYNLNYKSLVRVEPTETRMVAIQRKIAPKSFDLLDSRQRKVWAKYHSTFVKTLKATKFGAVAIDYDRTLCSEQNRLEGPSQEIISQMVRILRAGFLIGIVTGRGQSVRRDLQKLIPKKYWTNILIGYYNGAEIASLDIDRVPHTNASLDPVLEKIADRIKQAKLDTKLVITPRPLQLTIESKDGYEWECLKNSIHQIVMLCNESDFLALESSRSIDIVKRPEVSKLNMVKHCRSVLIAKGMSNDCLCIGDKGRWPGNDFELLSTKTSLSVNEVSIQTDSCWNLSPLGITDADACLFYLKQIVVKEKYFIFDYHE